MIKEDKKKKMLINFKKASSLLAKVTGMVEKDCYCISVMQQNLAIIGLLRSAHEMLMENHLNTCFRSAMASKNEKKKQQMTEEILKVTSLYNK
jgi:CsoR family transcriptional regulator, copper-sensing transcriptional repressor